MRHPAPKSRQHLEPSFGMDKVVSLAVIFEAVGVLVAICLRKAVSATVWPLWRVPGW